jgi:TonB family protein
MNTNHSSAKRTYEYQPTIIESRLLIERLAIQLAFFQTELKRSWSEFKRDPATFVTSTSGDLFRRVKKSLMTSNTVPACLSAVVTVAVIVVLALWIEKKVKPEQEFNDSDNVLVELVMLNAEPTKESKGDKFGKDGRGRVGLNQDKGEGSGPVPKPAHGGGGGGNRNPKPSQVGALPPPSVIPAAIPIAPPVHTQALPVAGIVIDPALWKDLKAPVYGDPRSTSEVPSKGPGEGDGIGTNKGPGIGDGKGPGFARGNNGNTGGDSNEQGCCGISSGGPSGRDQPFTAREVEQRARLLFKPEPQYTEEARRNQIIGTVMLRVVFSSSGEVVQIRAVRTLPFGLTERAIAAARQIKFVPAMKGGHAVSVHMQLEYNFNLY